MLFFAIPNDAKLKTFFFLLTLNLVESVEMRNFFEC